MRELARIANLPLDDKRAETIAARLSGVLDELDCITEESLAGVEPLPIFTVQGDE